MTHPSAGTRLLDNAVWSALTGPHARFAERHGRAARYRSDVAPFHAVADPADPRAWAELSELAGPGAEVLVAGGDTGPFPGWETVGGIEGFQFVDVALRAGAEPEAVRLGAGDVPEMLDLVRRTEPGPFRDRTVELGTYLGVRRGGALVAMAGERLRVPGFSEISAVCTDPAFRGQGLGTRLIRAVAAEIRSRGETPFLHVAGYNTTAIRLYESLGFALRMKTTFGHYRALT